MHKDIHYFGTYIMARAAGLKPEICQTIATTVQYVDNNDDDQTIIEFKDGGRLIPLRQPIRYSI